MKSTKPKQTAAPAPPAKWLVEKRVTVGVWETVETASTHAEADRKKWALISDNLSEQYRTTENL